MTDKKVVLITGGAMGQGAMHAVEFAKVGYDCVLLDMLDPTDERFAAAVAEVEALGATVLPINTIASMLSSALNDVICFIIRLITN